MANKHFHGDPDSVPGAAGWLEWLRGQLGRQVNGTSLAVFRICVGVVMLLEAFTLFRPSASAGGRSHMEVYFTGNAARFHLPYAPFEALPILPDAGMTVVGWILGIGAVGLILGLWHRASAAAVFLSWGYLYAIESTRTYWMSYYYLELLTTFLLVWMPASRRLSIDARLQGQGETPGTVPAWCLVVFRAQLVVTYFHAGLAKMTWDWMADLMPVRWFLSQPHVAQRLESLVGGTFAAGLKPLVLGETGARFFSWVGGVFDLLVGFLLLFPRTRYVGLGLLWIFHATNHFLIFTDIEWFPLLGALTGTIFLAPDWPERLLRWLGRPRWRSPESSWAIAGGLLLPAVGVLLGWRARTTAESQPPPSSGRASTGVLAFVGVWIAFQSLFPLRHLLIPGDARITFEGLSFSWRLKAELYQSTPALIRLSDPNVLSTSNNVTRVDWGRWKGERVLYRELTPGRVDWKVLPRILVVTDPEVGERIVFNPLGDGPSVPDEPTARRLATEAWSRLQGHPPTALHRIVSLGSITDAYARAAATKGIRFPDRQTAASTLIRDAGRLGSGQMVPFLRRVQPFAAGFDNAETAPFLVIEDAAVVPLALPALPRVDRDRWRPGPETRGLLDALRTDVGGEPLVIHRHDPGTRPDNRPPVASLWQEGTASVPFIRWDLLQDAGTSKSMHLGINPFLLRRYARRIARRWEQDNGSYPQVHALTEVRLNGRPPQAVVDPEADLASVSATWLGHNPWIRDLEMARIPRTQP